MRSSTIILVIATLLLVGYIVWFAIFLGDVNGGYDYPSYKDCGSYSCGNSIIQYPFGKCGLLSSNCSHNHTLYLNGFYSFSGNCSHNHTLYLNGFYSFSGRVVGDITTPSYSTQTLQIAPLQITPFFYGPRETQDYNSEMYDWLFQGGIFNVSKGYIVGTIVNCTKQEDFQNVIQDINNYTVVDCTETNSNCMFFPMRDFQFDNCRTYTIIIPGNNNYNITADKNFEQLQQTGFQLTWSISKDCNSCLATGGRCYDSIWPEYDSCICPDDDAHFPNCSVAGRSSKSLSYMAELFFIHCAAFSIVVVSCISFHRGCCCKRTASDEEHTILEFMDPLDSTTPSVENFLHYYSSQVPTRYSYTQIRAYTNNFAEQLGKGGFGTVYRGKLPSGRMIAVKILDESKQSEQQFIAEVATVGSTYHVNLVRMLGYCSEGSKRALLYEYMVNGSLEKYIHGNRQDQLDWKQLYSIAIGTARGISYLHEECRNRILHCDIKPHNVLLDANFLPKVADFGLAKLSKREESHISAAHGGTLGYAAPEMWSRMYGPVTDKCDVYSYGILIMEMVGGRKNMDLDNKESRSSKFFYAEWAFKQVEKGEYANLREGYMSEEDQIIAKKLSLIGLWCIQFHASRRPRMSKVIQMLEGDVEITTPPYPFPVDTPPINQLSSSDQSSPSDQCSSSYALEVHPKSTVDTPTTVHLSSLDQSASANQCSSSYALEVEIRDPKITYTDQTSR